MRSSPARLLRRATLLGVVIATGCRTAADRGVVLQIADLNVPAEVGPTGTLVFEATAYSGGCVHFEGFEVERSTSVVLLVARGTDRGGPDVACTADVRLDKRTFSVPGPFTDPLTV